jgi:hypothetical protein
MRYGRTLLAGLGWVGILGGLALCVLILLSAYLALDDDRPGQKERRDGVVRLPSVPDAEVPRVPLARPSRGAAADDGGGSGGGGGAPANAATPRPGTTPRATAPLEMTPQAPAGGSSPPPVATPSPAATRAPGSDSPLPPPPSAPTLGDTSRADVGEEVGPVSPPPGQNTGDTLGDAVDTLIPLPPPGR